MENPFYLKKGGYHGKAIGKSTTLGFTSPNAKKNYWDSGHGISAVGSALFPASSHDAAHAVLIGHIHLVFAALFFLSLIYFSLFLFTKTDPSRQPSRKKLHRNKVYKTCGYIMIMCLLLIVILHFLPKEIRSPLKAYHPEFWLETIAVVAFGISWLIKGETLLRDEA